jgi:hypothetical protein
MDRMTWEMPEHKPNAMAMSFKYRFDGWFGVHTV